MSEGDTWLHKATHEVSLYLRAWAVQPTSAPLPITRTSSSKVPIPTTAANPNANMEGPVHKAESLLRSFCTKELKSAPDASLGVEEYVANATMDLIILSVWSILADSVKGIEALPVSI